MRDGVIYLERVVEGTRTRNQSLSRAVMVAGQGSLIIITPLDQFDKRQEMHAMQYENYHTRSSVRKIIRRASLLRTIRTSRIQGKRALHDQLRAA